MLSHYYTVKYVPARVSNRNELMLGNWCFVFGCNLYNKIGVGNDFTHPTNF